MLEDSSFYNNILTRQLERYTKAIGEDKNVEFQIQGYTSPTDFLRNMKEDIDIAFVDYYLGNGVTGAQILKQVRKIAKNCKVIIISQSESVKASLLTLKEGAKDFIHKDRDALLKSCLIVEEVLNEKLLNAG